MTAAEAVRKQIADPFLGVHGDHRTKEERQADEEMRAAIQVDATIQGEADDTSEFIDWIEGTDVVEVDVMEEVTDDASDPTPSRMVSSLCSKRSRRQQLTLTINVYTARFVVA